MAGRIKTSQPLMASHPRAGTAPHFGSGSRAPALLGRLRFRKPLTLPIKGESLTPVVPRVIICCALC